MVWVIGYILVGIVVTVGACIAMNFLDHYGDMKICKRIVSRVSVGDLICVTDHERDEYCKGGWRTEEKYYYVRKVAKGHIGIWGGCTYPRIEVESSGDHVISSIEIGLDFCRSVTCFRYRSLRVVRDLPEKIVFIN